MALKSIVFALGVVTAACSGAGFSRHGLNAPVRHACAGGFVSSDRDLARYAGCEAVAGDLAIANVSTLAPLASVQSVAGTLRISGTARLYSFKGLEALESVGALEVQGNRALISVGGLKHLVHAERVLMSENPRLSSAFGLPPALTQGSSQISLARNAGLAAEGVGASSPHLADSRLAAH